MPGVGPATADRMYAKYGDEILNVFDSKNAVDLLVKVRVCMYKNLGFLVGRNWMGRRLIWKSGRRAGSQWQNENLLPNPLLVET